MKEGVFGTMLSCVLMRLWRCVTWRLFGYKKKKSKRTQVILDSAHQSHMFDIKNVFHQHPLTCIPPYFGHYSSVNVVCARFQSFVY